MYKVTNVFVEIVNLVHDFLLNISSSIGLKLTDKELHFYVLGILGILIILVTHAIFKIFAKWSIYAISFVHTFTLLSIIVLVIEIEQKATGRGNMELGDIVFGLKGFFIFLLFIGNNQIPHSFFEKNI
jgi:hypothetical protein